MLYCTLIPLYDDVVVVEKRGVETGRCGKGGDVVADERDADEDGGAKDRGVVCCRRR